MSFCLNKGHRLSGCWDVDVLLGMFYASSQFNRQWKRRGGEQNKFLCKRNSRTIFVVSRVLAIYGGSLFAFSPLTFLTVRSILDGSDRLWLIVWRRTVSKATGRFRTLICSFIGGRRVFEGIPRADTISEKGAGVPSRDRTSGTKDSPRAFRRTAAFASWTMQWKRRGGF